MSQISNTQSNSVKVNLSKASDAKKLLTTVLVLNRTSIPKNITKRIVSKSFSTYLTQIQLDSHLKNLGSTIEKERKAFIELMKNAAGNGVKSKQAILEFLCYFCRDEIEYNEKGQIKLSPNMMRKAISTIILEGDRLFSDPFIHKNLKGCINKNYLSLKKICISKIQSETLNMSKKKIYLIPREISNQKNLKTLTLDCNNIIFLPSEISSLTNLKYLYLKNNNITFLQPELAVLSLWLLDLRENNALPSSITKLIKFENKQDVCDLKSYLSTQKQ